MFKGNDYAQKLAKLTHIWRKSKKFLVRKLKKKVRKLKKTFREPAREARRHPEDVPSAGARSAPALETSSGLRRAKRAGARKTSGARHGVWSSGPAQLWVSELNCCPGNIK